MDGRGRVVVHATNNILNDLSDHRLGVDKTMPFALGGTNRGRGAVDPRQSLCLAVVAVIVLVTAIWLTLLVGQVLATVCFGRCGVGRLQLAAQALVQE